MRRRIGVQMELALPHYDVGVIIGRFQVHDLHDAHLDLVRYVCENHDKVLILLGISPLPVSGNNPLDFEARKQMILEAFPDVGVLYVKDQPSDTVWSTKVDEVVADFCSPGQTAILYGSRDSFIGHYSGRFSTRELIGESFLSGTATRKQIARSRTRGTPDFRAGVIWASQARFPTVYTTIDIAIFNANRLLLARKPNEKLFRFVGGFADPASLSFEDDARREAFEETTLEVGDLTYIGSTKVVDWRYRNEPDCIKTLLYKGEYLHGKPTPQDDIEELRWFNWNHIRSTDIVPSHRPLIQMLAANIGHTIEKVS